MNHFRLNNYIFFAILIVSISSVIKNQNQSLNTTFAKPGSNFTLTEIRHESPNPQFDHISYIWTIVTTNEKFKWYLKFKPTYEGDENKFFVNAHLSPDSKIQKARVNYSIAIMNDKHNVVCTCIGAFKFFKVRRNGESWGCFFFKNDAYFFDNKITILFNLSFCEDYTSMSSPTVHLSNHTAEYNLTDNFVSLYKNRKYPDVVLLVNETRHPAHKDVLSLRSPVFAAVFERGVEKGEKIKRIKITDLNDQVVEEMLRYIYTGKCENFDNLADGLLVAAQKYNLTRLKMNCVDALSEKFSVENALNMLLFADKNGVDELKSNAIRFIVKNYNVFSNNTDWELFIQKKPQIVHEVCQIVSKSNFGDVIRKYCT